MQRLCLLLGMPQHRFASIHVVGTNGKTSVTRMIAALLEANGASAGAYTSPHILDWRERIQIRGDPISSEAFDRVLDRAEEAAATADRSAGDEGPVTQYELLTAAAFLAFAEAKLEWAVIEAGLGGRLDATNVIPSKLTVLTSVGLDHTEWLGDTVEEIAAEKLAVLRDHSMLIHGRLPDEVVPVLERFASERHVEPRDSRIGNGIKVRSQGFQSENLAVATAAAEAIDEKPRNFAPELALLEIPGRNEFVDGDPPLIFDAAHNPDGAEALAESLRGLDRGIACCLAVLAEKDARGIVEALAPACSHFVCTEIPEEAIRGSGKPSGESHPAATLAGLCREAGVEAEAVADPLEAWPRTRDLARERGAVALAAGSHYLLSCIWTERHAPSS